MSSAEITPYDPMPVLRVEDVVHQVALIQEVMAAVMKEGEHYGRIPGCGNKPALLQPGAQVLALTFRLAPSFDVEIREQANLHREYGVKCNLASIASGQLIAQGVGSCSTMESKYRYRNVADYDDTGEPVPDDYQAKKAEYRKKGFGAKKIDDVWKWVRYKDSEKVENPDIADTYNTVMKMACKRAFVHGVLNATAASDMFTQDIEDLPEQIAAPEPKAEAWQLDVIRKARKALGVTDATYKKQLTWAQNAAITKDSELTRNAAARLLAAYEAKQEAAERAAHDAEVLEHATETLDADEMPS